MAFACGPVEEQLTITNREPIEQLKIGDKVRAGDFEIELTSVTANNKRFTGEGMAMIPMLGFARIPVTYENIQVNTDKQLINGKFVSKPRPGNLPKIRSLDRPNQPATPDNPGGPADGIYAGIVQPVSGTITEVTHVPATEDSPAQVLVYLEGEDEPTVLTFDEDNPQPLIIQDEAGNSYQVTPEGNVTQISTSQPGTTTDATLYRISFLQNPEPAPGIKGGFDSPEERSYPGQNYPSREIQGENYPLAYKAVANGRLDHVLAQARKQGETQTEATFPEDVAFKTETSNAVSQALADSPYKKVQVLGLGHQQESDLIAYKRIQTTGDDGEEEREEILGAVRTISYNEQREKVVVVPVNGAQLPGGFTAQLQNQLNDIYGQAIAQWDVRIAPNLNYQPASPFDNGTTGALANLPA